MNMKEVIINTPSGYTSLISSEYETIDNTNISNYLDINELFWKDIFSDISINKTLKYAEKYYKKSESLSLKMQVILNNTSLFYKNLMQALNFKFSINTTKQEYFCCLETLEMFCELYTVCWTSPFQLNIAEGFIHPKDSSMFLDEFCMNSNYNPYLSFIEKLVIPKLAKDKVDILWVHGRPNIAIFSLLKYIKTKFPKIYIVLCDPKTEYYSLFKIKELLIRNTPLFNIFDCILFTNEENSRREIVTAVAQRCEPQNAYGCLYRSEDKIIYKENISHIPKESIIPYKISLKLFTNHCCYWNKCTFCGINQKYDMSCENDLNWDITRAIDVLIARSKNKNKYMWLIDEAIPPIILKKLVLEFSKYNFNFIWHFRTRIEPELVDVGLVDLLWENGVRSIILGFESASKRILKHMNKTFCDDYLIIAEKIVALYTSKGIHIHFPVLIGFPTETDNERELSFQFVEYLSEKYPLFSYNINILELDISSSLFKNWLSYDIKQLKFPCPPKYFLGNSIEWDSDYETLNQQRNLQMKRQFIWYPNESCLSVNTFYNLWEQKKGLLCNENVFELGTQKFVLNSNYNLNSNTLLFQLTSGDICLYNYDTHIFICGGEIIKSVYNALSEHWDTNEIISKYSFCDEEILKEFLKNMYELKFII